MRFSLAFIAVVMLSLGVLFVLVGGAPLLADWRYRHQAVRTDAEVTGKRLLPATESSSTSYELSYRVALEGQPYERTDPVPVHVWERLERGAVMRVEHFSGQADSVRMVPDTSTEYARWIPFIAIGAILAACGLTAALYAVRHRPGSHAIGPNASASPLVVPDAAASSYWPLARGSVEFWLGMILMAVGLPIFVVTGAQMYEDWRFAWDAVSTDGMILTKDIKRSRSGQRITSYGATYRFMVPEGTFEGRTKRSYADWVRLQERHPVEVLYLPDSPSESRIAGPRSWVRTTFPSLFGCMLGFMFLAIGARLFGRAVRHARLEWRLRRHGAAADGTVTDVRDRHITTNGVRQWRLHYEYNDFLGVRHAATHDLPEDEALPWEVGAVGGVRYDPAKPTEAIWLGRS